MTPRSRAPGTRVTRRIRAPRPTTPPRSRRPRFLPHAATGLVELFEAQARRRPTHTAVVDRDTSLDYATLDHRANHLAHALVARSVRPGDVVGLHAKRSCDLAVGILGILKAGAAYLPLDPGQPAERLATMVEDAACPVVLSDHDSADRASEWLDLHAVEAEKPTGRTGKGHPRVSITHRTSSPT